MIQLTREPTKKEYTKKQHYNNTKYKIKLIHPDTNTFVLSQPYLTTGPTTHVQSLYDYMEKVQERENKKGSLLV